MQEEEEEKGVRAIPNDLVSLGFGIAYHAGSIALMYSAVSTGGRFLHAPEYRHLTRFGRGWRLAAVGTVYSIADCYLGGPATFITAAAPEVGLLDFAWYFARARTE